MSEREVVSSFFSNNSVKNDPVDISDDFLHLVEQLNSKLEEFKYPDTVKYVYNPTIYARYTFEMYVRKYCCTRKPIMYFGMNPGPFGMSQTGVPFGEISSVRDWLGIQGPVGKPPVQHPARCITGFDCPRTEQSGKRFWGFFKNLCGTPDNFFKTSFVYNYFPEQWMGEKGANLTPEALKAHEEQRFYSVIDPIFSKILELYDVKIIVAIGRFCEKRAVKTIENCMSGKSIKIVYMPHPSPRSGTEAKWYEDAQKCLVENKLLQYYKQDN